MHPCSLAGAFKLKEREIIAAYGAGGKTTLLNQLARELGETKRVIITTTTKMHQPPSIPTVIAVKLVDARRELARLLKKGNPVVAVGSARLPGDKLQGVDPSWVEQLHACDLASHILVEADGASQKSVKGFAPHEPVLPGGSTLILPVAALSALGATMDAENVHRPEFFSRATGAERGERINLAHLAGILRHMRKIGKTQAPGARQVIILNKTDLVAEAKIKECLQALGECFPAQEIIATSFRTEVAPQYIYTSSGGTGSFFTSCVILAAGSSTRMGRDKMALMVDGKTLLETAVNNALASLVNEVIVVVRPQDQWVHKVLPAPVKVVANPDCLQGVSTSLKMGLSRVDPSSQAVIFSLGDQPFVTPGVYNDLMDCHLRHFSLLVYPEYNGQRGNPVLFDRRIWPGLTTLTGDTGGKQILARLTEGVGRIKTRCPGVLIDFDTPADFAGIPGT